MTNTRAKDLLRDPEYQQGKATILQAIRNKQQSLQQPSPPHGELQLKYDQLIASMNHLRGNDLYYPLLGSGFGNGLFVELADGSCKYDLISGIGVQYFGHSYLDLIDKMIDASVQDIIMQGNLHQNTDSHELLKQLVQTSGMDHGLITTSGAMANENALKIIFQKKHPRTRLLAFDGCFMGRTLTLSHISDKAAFRKGLPLTVSVDYLPFYEHNNHQGSIENTKNRLHKLLRRYPEQHAAICIEPVQGENGFYPGNSEFFREILSLCKQHDIAILIDEVQTFGRTPQLFAMHHFAIQEYVDVVTLGKACQVAATLWKKEYNPQPGLLSQTFTASTTAIQAAIFTLQYAQSSSLFGNEGKITTLHKAFSDRLNMINTRFPGMCEGPYGIGSMIAFTPCFGDHKKVQQFARKLFDNGIIAFIAGSLPTRIRFLIPAAIITHQDVDAICNIIEQTIEQML